MVHYGHDYYKVLGLSFEANAGEIKTTRKRLFNSEELHPDKIQAKKAIYIEMAEQAQQAPDPEVLLDYDRRISAATTQAQLVNEACTVLLNHKTREEYDAWYTAFLFELNLVLSPTSAVFGSVIPGEKFSTTVT